MPRAAPAGRADASDPPSDSLLRGLPPITSVTAPPLDVPDLPPCLTDEDVPVRRAALRIAAAAAGQLPDAPDTQAEPALDPLHAADPSGI